MADEKTPFDTGMDQIKEELAEAAAIAKAPVSPPRVRANAPVSRAARAEPMEGRARLLDPNRPISEMEGRDEGGTRLSIPLGQFPDGMDFRWVATAVNGMPLPQHRAEAERRGWTPVHQSDFEGKFKGRWMAPETQGEINVDGLVLCTRPMRWSDKARAEDRRAAQEAVIIKERQLQGGELEGVTMDEGSRHPNALRFNRIRRSMERIDVPKD